MRMSYAVEMLAFEIITCVRLIQLHIVKISM